MVDRAGAPRQPAPSAAAAVPAVPPQERQQARLARIVSLRQLGPRPPVLGRRQRLVPQQVTELVPLLPKLEALSQLASLPERTPGAECWSALETAAVPVRRAEH
jgi:hypothetical protein